MGPHTRRFSLPHGYSAELPAFPRIKKHRAFRKFVTAYQAVRREFYTDIAAIVGGNVLIIDTDLVTIDGMEVITTPRKH